LAFSRPFGTKSPTSKCFDKSTKLLFCCRASLNRVKEVRVFANQLISILNRFATVFTALSILVLIVANISFVVEKKCCYEKKSFYLFENIKAVKFQEDYLDWKLDKFDLYKKAASTKIYQAEDP
jgi:hypothetical protein